LTLCARKDFAVRISPFYFLRTGTKDFAHEKNTREPRPAATSGAAIGGTLGWLVGIGALAIPGLGPLIAAGPIMAALAGAGAGGVVGGLAGALVVKQGSPTKSYFFVWHQASHA
jgi:hypothetical protein